MISFMHVLLSLKKMKILTLTPGGTKSPPCSNLSTFENYTYPTTQDITNSQSPLRVSSETEHEDSHGKKKM